MTLASFRHFNHDWKTVLHRPAKPCIQPRWTTGEQQECSGGARKPRENWLNDIERIGVEIREWTPPRDDLSPVHASDVFSWHILSTEGGLYCDMDILFIAPVESGIICDMSMCHTWVCMYRDVFPIGFMAASENNQFFRDVYDVAMRRSAVAYQGVGCEAATETIHSLPEFLYCGESMLPKTRYHAIQSHYKQKVLSYDREIIYPWLPHEISSIFIGRHHTLPNTTVGIHWYGGAGLSQRFNFEIDSKTVHTINNTFTHYARKVPIA